MKKTILAISLTLVAIHAALRAQTMYDAMTFSQNNYYGTARSLGMGNALVAVGGDLGSIGLNPAGSAVAGYSQLTFTPGVSISSTGAAYAPSYIDDGVNVQVFGGLNKNSRTKFVLPNIGTTLRIPTGRNYGLRAITFGFVSSLTDCYLQEFTALGREDKSSRFGSFAAYANVNADGRGSQMNPTVLSQSNFFNNSGYLWNYLTAYDGGLINYNSDAGTYYGSTEFKDYNDDTGEYTYSVPGTLSQYASNNNYGTKNDLMLNLGLNFSDKFYLGFNLGLPIIRYRSNEYYRESSVVPEDFPITPEYYSSSQHAFVADPLTNFISGVYQYNYSANGTGIYFKAGAIFLPTSSLRVGVSIQTPTAFTINESWQVSQASTFANATSSSSSYSPVGEYSYRLRTPYIIDAGLAWTFGSTALLSFDYELTDFSVMQYREISGNGHSDTFYRVNRINSLFCGVSHQFRVGFEANVNPALKLRAGFNLKTDPERYYTDSEGNFVDASVYDTYFNDYESGALFLTNPHFFKNSVKAFSLGIGYSSPGSFFADAAVRLTTLPVTYYSFYSQYLASENGVLVSPCAQINRKLWDVAITVGWRF